MVFKVEMAGTGEVCRAQLVLMQGEFRCLFMPMWTVIGDVIQLRDRNLTIVIPNSP